MTIEEIEENVYYTDTKDGEVLIVVNTNKNIGYQVLSKTFHKGHYFTTERDLRLSTPSEIEHIEQCIKAGKYVDHIPTGSTVINNYELY